MTILIDSFFNGARGPYHYWYRRCSHLVSDTSIEELHAFAAGLGLRREWFQRRSIPHYDLVGERFDLALARGAVLVSSRELVRRAVRWDKRKPRVLRISPDSPKASEGDLTSGIP